MPCPTCGAKTFCEGCGKSPPDQLPRCTRCVTAGRAVVLLEQGLARIGRRAIAFLPVHQPERENGERVWRLTALAGQLKYGLTIDEATLNDPEALDAFLRQHTTDEKGVSHMHR